MYMSCLVKTAGEYSQTPLLHFLAYTGKPGQGIEPQQRRSSNT